MIEPNSGVVVRWKVSAQNLSDVSPPRGHDCAGPPYGVKGGRRPSPTAITTLDSFGRSLKSGL